MSMERHQKGDNMTNEELKYIKDLCVLGYINNEAWSMIFTHCKPEESRNAVDREEVLQCLWELEDVGEMLKLTKKIKSLKAVAPVAYVIKEEDGYY